MNATDKACMEFAGNIPREQKNWQARRMLDLICEAREKVDSVDAVLDWHELTNEMRHELKMLSKAIQFILDRKAS